MTTRKRPNTPWYLLGFHYWGACRDTTPISIRSSPLPASPAGRAMVEQRCIPHASQICGARLQRSHAMNRYTSPVVSSVGQKTRSVDNRPDRRQLLKLAAAAPIMPVIAGCSTLTRGNPPPASVADQVTVLGIANGRFWPDTQVEAMAREGIEAAQREYAALGATGAAAGLFPGNIGRRRERRLRCGSVVRLA